MPMGTKGLDRLTELEGFRTHVYKDVAGFPTIGVGHLLTQSELSSGKLVIAGDAVRYGDGLTVDQVKALLAQDVGRFERAVDELVDVPLKGHQYDALVSFSFNVGVGAFQRSTLLKVLNRREYAGVPAQLMRWVHAGGRRVRGLVKRREHEVEMWEGPPLAMG